MKRLFVLALTVLALAATSEAQTRDYTISWPTAQEADMLAAFARVYPQAWSTTLADGSKATLTYGLTVCVPASAAEVAEGVCTARDTTLPERRTILRRQLRGYLREMYRAQIGATAADAARATALATADAAVPVEQP